MRVESVGGIALGSSRPRATFRALLVVTVTIATGVALLLPTPAANAQDIEGTDRDDLIVGTAQFDRIRARGGGDLVRARGDSDSVFGGTGNDTIRGGPGGDNRLEGGSGNDTIFGGPGGETTLSGGTGNDELHGGAKRDQIGEGSGADTVHGGRGNDHVESARTPRSGTDSVYGGPGNDTFVIEADGLADLFDCGAGRDTVLFESGRRDELDQLIDCEVVKFI